MRRSDERELLDGDAYSIAELRGNFRDIERANRWFGGVAPVRAFVRDIGARSVLDVGCGSGDICRALVRDAERRGHGLRVVGLDRSDDVLGVARTRGSTDARVTFVRGDGEALPFDRGAFDVVTCSLTLHHCSPDVAVRLLREMRRVAGRSPFVCDLRRSWGAFGAAATFALLCSRNRLTRHDAPLSAKRAYTPAEAVHLARRAGWARAVVRASPLFRFVLFDA